MASVKRLTDKDIQLRINEAHGKGSIKLITPFGKWDEKNTLKCKCGNKWDALVRNVIHLKTGCPVCSKSRQAANIATGHANSKLRINKYRARIKLLEEQFNLSFIGSLPTKHSDKCRFRCEPCGHEWEVAVSRLAAKKYGCPECAEELRLQNSNTAEILEERSLRFRLSSKEARRRILRATQGRTTLVSKWNGAAHPRRFECNLCDHRWIVRKKSDGIMTGVLCPECTIGGRHSAIATAWLRQESEKRGIEIQHGKNGGEYRLPGTRMFVDGYHAKSKTVFEFHGDAFHGNPKVYAPSSNPHPYSRSRASTLYKRTKEREKLIREMGYKLVVMWEADYKASFNVRNR